MLGRLIVVASTTLTFVASCGPDTTGREPRTGPEIGRPLVIDRIGPDGIEACQNPDQPWPGEAIFDPVTGEYTCERS